jgi:hypothetical protein
VKFVVRYNWDSQENTWTISQGNSILYQGPQYSPLPFSRWTTTFDNFPVGDGFCFTMFDSAGDGMGGWFGRGYFEVYQEIDGVDILLARGDHRFDDSSTICFNVDSTRSTDIVPDNVCRDKIDDNAIQVTDSIAESCWFLNLHASFAYLCEFIDVAMACPETCGICSELESLNCDTDSEGVVALDHGTVSEASCDFLKETQNRFGFACQRTAVALHCPVTCNLDLCID